MSEKRLAIITGGSRGIGKACAIEFAKAGLDVAITYAGNDEAAEATLKELTALGANATAYKFDVSKKDAAEANVTKILEKYGRIDVLVNNAGITRDGLFVRMSAKNWEDVIRTNLSGAFYMTNPTVKTMMKQRFGAIVNLSSIVGIAGNAGQANYSAAKAGIIGFTKSLAKELGARNIRVNAVAPGFVKTDMTKGLDAEKIIEHIPLKRLAQAEDVAKVVKFLALDADYVTGEVLGVDGGLSI